MARPKAKQLTERELEIMHIFWRDGAATVADVRGKLRQSGRRLAYTTVATLVKILVEKKFLRQTNTERPFVFEAVRTFDDVSQRIVGDMVQRVFGGSRELLLQRLFEQRSLSDEERKLLEEILREADA